MHVRCQTLNSLFFYSTNSCTSECRLPNIHTWTEKHPPPCVLGSHPLLNERQPSVRGWSSMPGFFSLLINSACLFTCSLLTLEPQPPVTLLLKHTRDYDFLPCHGHYPVVLNTGRFLRVQRKCTSRCAPQTESERLRILKPVG